ncbi:MAG: helicase associated domain-containing protein [Alphaproteobacteria bacterium]|jgi:hypothetical protein
MRIITKAALTQKLEEGFAALVRFHNREGYCLVKSGYIKDDLKLGAWVSRQRTNKDTLYRRAYSAPGRDRVCLGHAVTKNI